MLFDEDISEGLYDITLGISLEGLVFKTIESISITIDRQFYSEPAEVLAVSMFVSRRRNSDLMNGHDKHTHNLSPLTYTRSSPAMT
jgi:hypothetical protein